MQIDENLEIMNHLTEEQIAMTADLQSAGKYNEVPDEIREHLSHCDQCALEVVMVNQIIQNESKKKVIPGRYRTLTYALSAAALLILITFSFFFRNLNPSKESVTPNQQIAINEDTATKEDKPGDDTIKTVQNKKEKSQETPQLAKKTVIRKKNKNTQKKEQKQLAVAEYKTNAQLEKLVARYQTANLRAADLLNYDKEIKYPKRKTIQVPNDQHAYLIEIYNNKGEMISEVSAKDSTISLPKLEKGLYYWKLMNEEFDLIYVGRIKATK